jgi:hypothetical protein
LRDTQLRSVLNNQVARHCSTRSDTKITVRVNRPHNFGFNLVSLTRKPVLKRIFTYLKSIVFFQRWLFAGASCPAGPCQVFWASAAPVSLHSLDCESKAFRKTHPLHLASHRLFGPRVNASSLSCVAPAFLASCVDEPFWPCRCTYSIHSNEGFLNGAANRVVSERLVIRVTRLVEIWPIWWLFTLGSFLHVPEIGQIIGVLI